MAGTNERAFSTRAARMGEGQAAVGRARPLAEAIYQTTVWGFDEQRIWGLRIGYLPLEEYLFFGLQTVLTGLWVYRRLRALRLPPRGEA